MIPPIDVSTLSPPAQKIAAPDAPQKLQEMAARGIAPGLRPAEVVALLVLLSESTISAVRETAQKTLGALPDPVLSGALGGDLPPAAIDALARAYGGRADVLDRIVQNPRVAMETIEHLAQTGVETVTELIATNEERLLGHPRIIELLYLNKHTRMSTADRLIDLAARNGVTLTGIAAFKEAVIAVQDELIMAPGEEPTPDDIAFRETQELSEQLASAPDEDTHEEDAEGKEQLKDKFAPLYARIANMRMSEKVRRATLGSKEERMLLIRDNNRVVASAAVHSPLLQEPEAVLISRNRNISDEVLRVIATKPELCKSYIVKKNLVENPKTPIAMATRLVQFLRESDLRLLAKSKNVTGPVQDAARRHLEKRKG